MIKQIKIEAFRKHRDLTLDLDPNVTVLVGGNDQGKSTVIKALMWVVFNRPQGESVIPHGGKSARVGVRVKKSWVFRTRVKNGENSYEVGNEVYKAFGTGVPEAVGQELKLDEINFQRQIDPPFWLTLSPPEVAREMNKVVDLEVIDTAVAYAASRVRSCNDGVKELQGAIDEAELTIGRLRWVQGVELLMAEAQRCSQEARVATLKAERLRGLVEAAEAATKAVFEVPDIAELGDLITEILRLQHRETSLNEMIESIDEAEGELCRVEKSFTQAAKEMEAVTPKLCRTCGQPIETNPSLG